MQVGVITIGGFAVGTITLMDGTRKPIITAPGLYTPEGRAGGRTPGDYAAGNGYARHAPRRAPDAGRRDAPSAAQPKDAGDLAAATAGLPPEAPAPGKTYSSSGGGRPARRASPEVDAAIAKAAKAYDLDPDTMRAIASVESSNNPDSNRGRSTQYKGLYQMGRNEWERFGGGGDVYNAEDNAMGAARMFDANRKAFRGKFGRDPTDTEYYLMHQQGLGFYTRGAMTNIEGNPYPGMRGPQTHDSFEAGWGKEIARRKEAIKNPQAAAPSGPTATPSNEPGRGSANHMHGQYGDAGDNLVTIKTPSGKTARVHEAAAPSFNGFLAELEGSGYKINSLGGHNHRTISGSGRLSQHAYGNAIDINPGANPMQHGLKTDMPANISDMAARHGLSWGGDWKGRKDPMHFEWIGKQPAVAAKPIQTPTKAALTKQSDETAP